MEEVPFHLKGLWGRAMDSVLRRVQDAPEPGEELDRALKWFLLLPQAFLRMAPKGGAAGRSLVASRFNALTRGDWGAVFQQWNRDRERAREKARRRERRPPREEEGEEQKEDGCNGTDWEG